MERKIVFSEDEFYHVYNRGVEKRLIFRSDKDKQRFLKLLYVCNRDKKVDFKEVANLQYSEIEKCDPIVAIGAYCLMGNHFHLLLKEIKKGGISSFMSKLSTAYVMYFNKKYNRTGPLFQGRFKAEHCVRDEHLKYLYAYIHLNPVKIICPNWKTEGIDDFKVTRKHLDSYMFSSYHDYLGVKREESLILDPYSFPDYFSEGSFENFINFWINYSLFEK